MSTNDSICSILFQFQQNEGVWKGLGFSQEAGFYVDPVLRLHLVGTDSLYGWKQAFSASQVPDNSTMDPWTTQMESNKSRNRKYYGLVQRGKNHTKMVISREEAL